MSIFCTLLSHLSTLSFSCFTFPSFSLAVSPSCLSPSLSHLPYLSPSPSYFLLFLPLCLPRCLTFPSVSLTVPPSSSSLVSHILIFSFLLLISFSFLTFFSLLPTLSLAFFSLPFPLACLSPSLAVSHSSFSLSLPQFFSPAVPFDYSPSPFLTLNILSCFCCLLLSSYLSPSFVISPPSLPAPFHPLSFFFYISVSAFCSFSLIPPVLSQRRVTVPLHFWVCSFVSCSCNSQ